MATPSRVFHAPFLKVMMIIFEFLKVSGSGITEAFTAIVAPYPDYWLVDMLRRCERLTPVLYFQSAPLYTRWRCDQCRYHDFLISIYPQGFYQSEPMALMQQSLTASATDIADRFPSWPCWTPSEDVSWHLPSSMRPRFDERSRRTASESRPGIVLDSLVYNTRIFSKWAVRRLFPAAELPRIGMIDNRLGNFLSIQLKAVEQEVASPLLQERSFHGSESA